MEQERKSIRVGVAVICCAVLLRLLGGDTGRWVGKALQKPQVISAVLLMETGRVVGLPDLPEVEKKTPAPTVETPETEPTETVPAPTEALPVFSPADAALVTINNACGYDTDVAAGLTAGLSWDLTEAAPSVLIIHSHGTESYENGDGSYRSTDVSANMISIGDRLVQVLEQGGIRSVHDRQMHDSPSYSDSYVNARASIQQYLQQYPDIRLVLDIHRDAVEDSEGNQLRFTVNTGAGEAAQLMLVVGTDAAGLSHPHWPENMSLAVKLHAQLEKQVPGICRPISFRSQRFNQDLSPGALIVEVGAAGNSHEEALRAVELLGQAIVELSKGTRSEES